MTLVIWVRTAVTKSSFKHGNIEVLYVICSAVCLGNMTTMLEVAIAGSQQINYDIINKVQQHFYFAEFYSRSIQ